RSRRCRQREVASGDKTDSIVITDFKPRTSCAGTLTGYVPMRNLSETEVAAPVTPYYAQRTATMYSSTSKTSKTLQTIPTGAKVDQFSVHGATGSWLKVRYNNQTC
ncbi:hypothetical protein ACW7EJ_10170, partial [Acinetobacter soli]